MILPSSSDVPYLHRILREYPEAVSVTSANTGVAPVSEPLSSTHAKSDVKPANSKDFFHRVCDTVRDTDRCVLTAIQSFLYAYAACTGMLTSAVVQTAMSRADSMGSTFSDATNPTDYGPDENDNNNANALNVDQSGHGNSKKNKGADSDSLEEVLHHR